MNRSRLSCLIVALVMLFILGICAWVWLSGRPLPIF